MMERQKLRYKAMASRVTSLGPGQRFVIWSQGCPRRCPGCIAPETQPLEGGHVLDVGRIAERIVNSTDTGMTISGGEPFLQSEALCDLLDRVREKRDLGVIVYTGYTLEELQELGGAKEALLQRIDVLIDGPYVKALNDDLGLRGSSNQRCIFLTERYRGQMDSFGKPGARHTEYRVLENGFFVIGIPTRQALSRLIPEHRNGGNS